MPQVSTEEESAAFGTCRGARVQNERREEGATWRLVYELKVSLATPEWSFIKDKTNSIAALASS